MAGCCPGFDLGDEFVAQATKRRPIISALDWTSAMIELARYPQLRLLAWNRNGQIDERDALALYEREWRFVDAATLEPEERALIDRLVHEFGAGVLNV